MTGELGKLAFAFGVAAVAAAGFAGSATAEPFGIEYTIDRNVFKKTARADQVLTFDVFSDSACTAAVPFPRDARRASPGWVSRRRPSC